MTGVNRTTILNLLATVGDRCEAILAARVCKVAVRDVQCAEVWGYVFCKERTRAEKYDRHPEVGGAYCYTAIERATKLILAWHLGRREALDAHRFAFKLAQATTGEFQVTTDGFKPYQTAIPAELEGAAFAILVKQYATKDDHRYSPGEVSGTVKTPCCGAVDPDRICTSHVERTNPTIRMHGRRMTRLTNAFSKKWDNHRAALAPWFAYYNFCRVHSTLKTTPAVAAGLADRPWTLRELVERSTPN